MNAAEQRVPRPTLVRPSGEMPTLDWILGALGPALLVPLTWLVSHELTSSTGWLWVVPMSFAVMAGSVCLARSMQRPSTSRDAARLFGWSAAVGAIPALCWAILVFQTSTRALGFGWNRLAPWQEAMLPLPLLWTSAVYFRRAAALSESLADRCEELTRVPAWRRLAGVSISFAIGAHLDWWLWIEEQPAGFCLASSSVVSAALWLGSSRSPIRLAVAFLTALRPLARGLALLCAYFAIQLGVSGHSMTWPILAVILAYAVALEVLGHEADRFSRRGLEAHRPRSWWSWLAISLVVLLTVLGPVFYVLPV